jgi:hypothetical protein
MMSKKRFLLKLVLFIVIFFVVERSCHSVTKGFALTKIHSDLSFNPDWEIPPLAPDEHQKVIALLDQPFTFLGNGAQCYAFQSQDGKTVIKFFKHHHMRVNSWLNRLELSPKLHLYRLKLTGGGKERLHLILGSCKISYDHLKEETGLIYIHLNKTNHLQKKLTIIDPIGIAHQVDLDQMEFVVQKKATMIYPTLKEWRAEGNFEAIKEYLDSVLALFAKRLSLNIADKDPVFKRNFGCLGSKAIEIDQSSFYYSTSLKKPYAKKRAFYFETFKLRRWVKKRIPEVSDYFEQRLNEVILNT